MSARIALAELSAACAGFPGAAIRHAPLARNDEITAAGPVLTESSLV